MSWWDWGWEWDGCPHTTVCNVCGGCPGCDECLCGDVVVCRLEPEDDDAWCGSCPSCGEPYDHESWCPEAAELLRELMEAQAEETEDEAHGLDD